MTVIRRDGKRIEAVILSQSETTIRVVLEGAVDVTEFVNVHGTWVSDDCEPVAIRFAWENIGPPPVPTESHCVCAKGLATRFIQIFETGNDPLALPELDELPFAPEDPDFSN